MVVPLCESGSRPPVIQDSGKRGCLYNPIAPAVPTAETLHGQAETVLFRTETPQLARTATQKIVCAACFQPGTGTVKRPPDCRVPSKFQGRTS